MLQAARQRAPYARAAVLATCTALQRSTRCASTAAKDKKVINATLEARRAVDLVSLFFEHPSKLLEATRLDTGIHSPTTTGFTFKLIAELAANPIVENRTKAMRELLALPFIAADPVRETRLQPSHADAIAQLSELPDEKSKAVGLGIIVRTRYADAPFLSAKDLVSALSFGNPKLSVCVHLAALPTAIHRLELSWEREALARRGTSPEAQQRAAGEGLLVLEDFLGERHPALLDDDNVRSLLLRAYAAAREHARAELHWRSLLERQIPKWMLALALNSRLAVARDVAELTAVWTEARAAYPPFVNGQGILLKHVEGVLLLHYARLGGVATGALHEVLGLQPFRLENTSAWAPLAREAEVQGAQLSDTSLRAEAFKKLRTAGMDWDGAMFLLAPFSEYLGRLGSFMAKSNSDRTV